MKLFRRKVRAGYYQLYDPLTGRVRAEIIELPDFVNVESIYHWLVYLDGDSEHCDGCKARTLRDAEANARARIAFDDANPLDTRSDQQRRRNSTPAPSQH